MFNNNNNTIQIDELYLIYELFVGNVIMIG